MIREGTRLRLREEMWVTDPPCLLPAGLTGEVWAWEPTGRVQLWLDNPNHDPSLPDALILWVKFSSAEEFWTLFERLP